MQKRSVNLLESASAVLGGNTRTATAADSTLR